MWLVGATHPIHPMVRVTSCTYTCRNKSIYFYIISAKSSDRKMQVTLKGVSKKDCDKMYRFFNVSFKSGQLCAGGEEGYDSCRGAIQLLIYKM